MDSTRSRNRSSVMAAGGCPAGSGGLAAQAPQARTRGELDESLEIRTQGGESTRELHQGPADDVAGSFRHLEPARMQESFDEQILLVGGDVPTPFGSGKRDDLGRH